MYKKSIIIIILSGTLFYSCDNQQKEEAANRISELEAKERQLQQQVQEKDSAFSSFVNAIAQVEKQLRTIHTAEIHIDGQQPSTPSPQELRDRISNDAEAIDSLIQMNEQIIRNLHARLNRSRQEKGELNTTTEKLRADLEAQIREREQNITLLKAQLDELQTTVITLHAEVDNLNRFNEEQNVTLNTAYYAMGDFKALRDEQILDKKGGFFGIFGGVKLLRDDFNRNKFTRINIRETADFPVEGKEISLVTVHPPDSYKIDKEASGEKVHLIVSDPDKFWEASKYMVMLVK